jgi:hypothetical protein
MDELSSSSKQKKSWRFRSTPGYWTMLPFFFIEIYYYDLRGKKASIPGIGEEKICTVTVAVS